MSLKIIPTIELYVQLNYIELYCIPLIMEQSSKIKLYKNLPFFTIIKTGPHFIRLSYKW